MAVKFQNECCDCASSLYPCEGDSCSLLRVPHFYCDKCGDEMTTDSLYIVDDEELCGHCLTNRFETIADQLEKGVYEYDE